MGKYKSECCNAPIRYSDFAPDFIGDNPKTMTVGTVYCICTKCNEPCNIKSKQRKTWAINPATRIKGDEREKIKRKIVKKETKDES